MRISDFGPYSAFRNPQSAIRMHLIIDGYNLLHVGRSPVQMSPIELQRERDQLIHQLSAYRQIKQCDITVVFDGWQGGWSTEKKERKKGIELIFSKLGEKADEVIKRLVKEKGSGAIVITSDRDVSKYAERMSVTVIPSDQFQDKMEIAAFKIEKGIEEEEAGGRGMKRKGPSRRLSKKERRARAALKKL
jgi:predicted RNA-binding protein with PIN domain